MELIIDDRIEQRRVKFFNSFSLELKYDSVASAFSFQMFYNPDNPEHVELAQISHYHIVKIVHNGEQLLRGYILSESVTSSAKPSLLPISGYSFPGVLEDCNIPTELYPLQYDGLTLREIANKLVAPFKIKIAVDSSVASRMDSVYDVSVAKETQTIKQYLAELASQKNIIISHNENGDLLFTQANTDTEPIADLTLGSPIVESMTIAFNGQGMHSHITVMKQASADGGNAGQATIRNPYVPYVYRPKVIKQNSGDDNDTETVAKMALAQELKGLRLSIKLSTWEINGEVIKPNRIVNVTNKDLSFQGKVKWFIESVSLQGDNTQNTATLNCVLPEVYNNKTPKNIFQLH